MKFRRHGSAHVARALHEMARLSALAGETPFRARGGAGGPPVSRVFLLSPAYCGGVRAGLVLDGRARFELARRVRAAPGAPLGDVFSFLSGLYFRGKLAYAEAFARPPAGVSGVLVITPVEGLRPAHEPVDLGRLRRYAQVDIDAADRRFRVPLLRDARRLARAAGAECEIVLLGSVATGKYLEPLLGVLGERLRFPADFVGRGDMSRGGLLLRSVRAGRELEYIGVAGAPRRGPRPARLTPSPERPPRARRVTRRAAVRSRGGSAARRGG